MTRTSQLFLALALPADFLPGEDNPDEIADEIARLINRQRVTSECVHAIFAGEDLPEDGVKLAEVGVGGIPSPQWLTRDTLAALRRAASS